MRNELLIAFKALQLDQGASGIVTRFLSPSEARTSTVPPGDASSYGWIQCRKEAGRADQATRPVRLQAHPFVQQLRSIQTQFREHKVFLGSRRNSGRMDPAESQGKCWFLNDADVLLFWFCLRWLPFGRNGRQSWRCHCAVLVFLLGEARKANWTQMLPYPAP